MGTMGGNVSMLTGVAAAGISLQDGPDCVFRSLNSSEKKCSFKNLCPSYFFGKIYRPRCGYFEGSNKSMNMKRAEDGEAERWSLRRGLRGLTIQCRLSFSSSSSYSRNEVTWEGN